MKLFADENFPLPVVTALRNMGHDVLTLQEAGVGGSALPDEQNRSFVAPRLKGAPC